MSYELATYDPGPARWLVLTCAAAADGPGVTRITLTGELDIATTPLFHAVLSRAARNAELVILNLSGLQFMDATGTHAILTADAQLRAADRRLALVPGPPQVQRIFELTGLTDRLPFINDGNRANGKLVPTGKASPADRDKRRPVKATGTPLQADASAAVPAANR